jgi:hypothetical protein
MSSNVEEKLKKFAEDNKLNVDEFEMTDLPRYFRLKEDW